SLADALSLRTRLHAPDTWIIGDETELQQVVLNLCTNAAQAMGGHGVITLDLDALAIGDAAELSHGVLAAGRYVRLAVSDTGADPGGGLAGWAMDMIFEPFFTTKPPGQGTGLGLSAVHGIVTSKNGVMNVRSRLGAGSIFEIYFPELDPASAFKDDGRTADLV